MLVIVVFGGIYGGIASLLTPPVGLNLYAMQGSTGEPLRKVVHGPLPFVWLQILVLGIVMLYPPLATFMPQKLF